MSNSNLSHHPQSWDTHTHIPSYYITHWPKRNHLQKMGVYPKKTLTLFCKNSSQQIYPQVCLWQSRMNSWTSHRPRSWSLKIPGHFLHHIQFPPKEFRRAKTDLEALSWPRKSLSHDPRVDRDPGQRTVGVFSLPMLQELIWQVSPQIPWLLAGLQGKRPNDILYRRRPGSRENEVVAPSHTKPIWD